MKHYKIAVKQNAKLNNEKAIRAKQAIIISF